MLMIWGLIIRPIKTCYGEIAITNEMAFRHFHPRMIPHPCNDNSGVAA